MAQILIVDDEPLTRGSVRRILEDDGHVVREAGSSEEALTLMKRIQPDLLVLDIVMPGMSGIDLCRRLRADPFYIRLPIIFLTAKSRPSDIAAGLDAGGDDYVTKPVEVIELPARVRARLRRVTGGSMDTESKKITVGDLCLSLTEFEIMVGNETIPVSSTEHRLLYTLMTHAGQPISVDQLLQDVWEYPPGVGDPNIVYAHIKNVRQKIEPESSESSKYLKIVRGRGYFITPA